VQLLAWERELDSRECILMAPKDGLVASEHAWNVTASATEPRLSGRTICLGCMLLQPVVDIP
jgi:hypothetical protein